MGIPNRSLGRGENPSDKRERASISLAFVLLSEAKLPRAEEITQAFRDFGAPNENVQDEGGSETEPEIMALGFNTGEKSFVALMPAAVPHGEADEGRGSACHP